MKAYFAFPIFRGDKQVGFLALSSAGFTIISDDEDLRSIARTLRPGDSFRTFVFTLEPEFNIVHDFEPLLLEDIKPAEPIEAPSSKFLRFLVFLKDGRVKDILDVADGVFLWGKLSEEFKDIPIFVFPVEMKYGWGPDSLITKSLVNACLDQNFYDIIVYANEHGYDVVPIQFFYWEFVE